MNSQPQEPEEPTSSQGPEFVPPLNDLPDNVGAADLPGPEATGLGDSSTMAPYDIPAQGPPKRYRNGVVWSWVFIGGLLTSIISPFVLGLATNNPDNSRYYGWFVLLAPLIGVIIGGVGLARSRTSENTTARSIYMGLLIGSALAVTCVGACYGIITGGFSGSGN